MRCGVVLVQVGKDRSEFLSRVRFEAASILCVHINHEVRVFGKERHSGIRIATIGAVRIGFDELANRETIRCLLRGDAGVLTHCWSPSSTRDTAEPFSIRPAARLPILLSAIRSHEVPLRSAQKILVSSARMLLEGSNNQDLASGVSATTRTRRSSALSTRLTSLFQRGAQPQY